MSSKHALAVANFVLATCGALAADVCGEPGLPLIALGSLPVVGPGMWEIVGAPPMAQSVPGIPASKHGKSDDKGNDEEPCTTLTTVIGSSTGIRGDSGSATPNPDLGTTGPSASLDEVTLTATVTHTLTSTATAVMSVFESGSVTKTVNISGSAPASFSPAVDYSFIIQASGTGEDFIDGAYLTLVPVDGVDVYEAAFLGNATTAQQFIMSPDGELLTADGLNVAALPLKGNMTLSTQFFVPVSNVTISGTSAKRALGPNHFGINRCFNGAARGLECSLTIGSTLAIRVFQLAPGLFSLLIGNANYGIAVVPIVVPVRKLQSSSAVVSATPPVISPVSAEVTSTDAVIPSHASAAQILFATSTQLNSAEVGPTSAPAALGLSSSIPYASTSGSSWASIQLPSSSNEPSGPAAISSPSSVAPSTLSAASTFSVVSSTFPSAPVLSSVGLSSFLTTNSSTLSLSLLDSTMQALPTLGSSTLPSLSATWTSQAFPAVSGAGVIPLLVNATTSQAPVISSGTRILPPPPIERDQ